MRRALAGASPGTNAGQRSSCKARHPGFKPGSTPAGCGSCSCARYRSWIGVQEDANAFLRGNRFQLPGSRGRVALRKLFRTAVRAGGHPSDLAHNALGTVIDHLKRHIFAWIPSYEGTTLKAFHLQLFVSLRPSDESVGIGKFIPDSSARRRVPILTPPLRRCAPRNAQTKDKLS